MTYKGTGRLDFGSIWSIFPLYTWTDSGIHPKTLVY